MSRSRWRGDSEGSQEAATEILLDDWRGDSSGDQEGTCRGRKGWIIRSVEWAADRVWRVSESSSAVP